MAHEWVRTSNNTPGIKEFCNGEQHFIMDLRRCKCRNEKCTCPVPVVLNDLYESTTPAFMAGHVGD